MAVGPLSPEPEQSTGPRRPTDPFDAPAVVWRPISAKLATARRIVTGVMVAVLALLLLLPVLVFDLTWPAWGFLLLAAAYGWAWWLIGRQVSAWAYAERSEELLVRSGRLWRRIVVVPYGRLQYVDVDAGPLARAFGIASVQLHTASAGTDSRIPGLAATEAATLRDRLTERGQAQLAGL